jgi:hypothetical protein
VTVGGSGVDRARLRGGDTVGRQVVKSCIAVATAMGESLGFSSFFRCHGQAGGEIMPDRCYHGEREAPV